MGKGEGDANCSGPGMGDLLGADQEEWLYGWALVHDYDPTWDYEVRFDLRHHRLSLLAQSVAEKLGKEHPLPWHAARVYPADLDGPLAVYINGTHGAPVVVIDLEAHQRKGEEMGLDEKDIEVAIADSVLHELRHAFQAANEWPMDEDEAEWGSERIPF